MVITQNELQVMVSDIRHLNTYRFNSLIAVVINDFKEVAHKFPIKCYLDAKARLRARALFILRIVESRIKHNYSTAVNYCTYNIRVIYHTRNTRVNYLFNQ